eukprot:CAMPEP_0114678422 /NCGR_PEP_ID=MMETSP0191-20121206/51715_1 /TAXON_ID=126664 /ORGANISM="Sorites sp." /LENGTH=99 /DNA_ID=CAMNT_0001952395 /DNA_START=41 /DNA_END=337 /DNA_ORIENTATION=-
MSQRLMTPALVHIIGECFPISPVYKGGSSRPQMRWKVLSVGRFCGKNFSRLVRRIVANSSCPLEDGGRLEKGVPLSQYCFPEPWPIAQRPKRPLSTTLP